MSRKESAFISLYQDVSWSSDSVINPDTLWVDSESLALNKEIKSLDNLTRGGRIPLISSQVSGAVKPAGDINYQPRPIDLNKILYSHFQCGTQLGTDTTPGTNIYVPSKNNPIYSDEPPCNGGYGEGTGGVYSVSILKKYFDTNGTNSTYFKHGICDTLEFNVESRSDLKVKASYKFRDYVSGTQIAGVPDSALVGSYSSDTPWEGFHGTLLIDNQSIPLETFSTRTSNNLIERSSVARQNPEDFTFGDFTAEGNFSMNFPTDGLSYIGSMIDVKEFGLSGTFLNGANLLIFDMPHCVRMPFDVNLDKRVTMGIPYKAFEKDGTSPITVLVAGNSNSNDFFLDAINGTRNLPDLIQYDAGNGTRNLGEYLQLDRDL